MYCSATKYLCLADFSGVHDSYPVNLKKVKRHVKSGGGYIEIINPVKGLISANAEK